MQLAKHRSAAANNRVRVVEQLQATTPAECELRDVYRLAEAPSLAIAEALVGTHAAEDVLHDVFVKLREEWEKLPPEAHSSSYFIQCVRNRAIDFRRRERKYTELPDEEEELENIEAFRVPTPDPVSGHMASIDVVGPILAQIPTQRRRALVLRLQGIESIDVASRLGIDAQVVRKYVRMATAELIAGLEQMGIAPTAETLAGLLPAITSEPTNE
jgi:RNA polymerase sigma factor (sigma-70 family)